MKHPLFTGVCTALITPFLNGNINYPLLEQLLKRQLEAGIRTVVLCGTTGEASTLSDEEKITLIRRAKEFVGNSMTVIAGTGSNDTYHASSLTADAQEAGADAVLVVTPYYNKANPEGLFIHYRSVAAATELPVIIYNVPSRTGVDMPAEVCRALSEIPNIAGIKEASGSISKVAHVISQCPEEFAVWSGNDDMTLPIISLGGHGVISVVSNVAPAAMNTMTQAALAGDSSLAACLQRKLLALMDAMFCDINPIPVKEAMKLLGYDCGSCRLPLTQLTAEKELLLRRNLLRFFAE